MEKASEGYAGDDQDHRRVKLTLCFMLLTRIISNHFEGRGTCYPKRIPSPLLLLSSLSSVPLTVTPYIWHDQ